MAATTGRGCQRFTDLRQKTEGCRQPSRLFGLAFGLFFAFAHGQRLFESLADLIQALVIQVVCTLGALGAQVYQFVVFAHGLYV
jgi:hypothetical protein